MYALSEEQKLKKKARERRCYLKKTEGKVKRQTGSTKDRKKYEFERSLRRYYGISPFDYEFMLAQCEGKCPVCNRTWGWNGKNSKPHIDHDHITMKVRGILCGYCNISEGYLSTPEAAINLAAYMSPMEISING